MREIAVRESAGHRLARALAEAGLDAKGSVLALPVAEALERVAEQYAAGLILVGSRGRSKVGSFVAGSVPARLASQGRTAVVVLPLGARLEPGSGHYDLLAAPA